MAGRQSKRVSRRGSRAASPAVVRPPLPDWTGGANVFVPQAYEAGYDYPLLVWVPAPGGDFDLARVMPRLSLRNFIAVEARGSETAVWRAIDRVRDRLSVHARRIWLVGHAAGGSDAFRMACRHPDAFAGVVSLGGAFPLDEAAFARIEAVRRMPMLLCCRQESLDAAHTDRTLRLFHAAGARLAMRIYRGSGELSRTALADVNRWLMDEICGSASAARAAVAG